MCKDEGDIKIVRWYFFGFFFGVVLFFLPDYIGRKKSGVLFLLPLSIA
jgi:hypothetical protein